MNESIESLNRLIDSTPPSPRRRDSNEYIKSKALVEHDLENILSRLSTLLRRIKTFESLSSFLLFPLSIIHDALLLALVYTDNPYFEYTINFFFVTQLLPPELYITLHRTKHTQFSRTACARDSSLHKDDHKPPSYSSVCV